MEYSMDDWDRMQREAERRVQQSQRQNAQRVSGSIPMPSFVRPPEKEARPHSSSRSQTKGLFDLLDLNRFEIDSDRSMILMMLALLSGEEKDDLLMLALLYIML